MICIGWSLGLALHTNQHQAYLLKHEFGNSHATHTHFIRNDYNLGGYSWGGLGSACEEQELVSLVPGKRQASSVGGSHAFQC